MPDEAAEAVQQVLQERARLAARRPDADQAAGGTLSVLRFGLGQGRFAVETRHVLETCSMDGRTELPLTPDFIHGVVALRGRILAIVDLAVILGLPVPEPSPDDHVVVLRGEQMEFGIRAGVIDGVVEVAPPASDGSLPAFAGRHSHLFLGISGDDLAILDGARLLAADELKVSGPTARWIPAAPVED